MTESSAPQKQFAIQKLYLKDASFESPDAPHSFSFTRWDPKIDLNLSNTNAHVDGDIYEAVLCVTATIKLEEKTAYLAEIQQSGIFTITGYEDQELGFMVGAFCPNILFPYAREAISDLVSRGGFPQLALAPVNFDALYHQHLQQMQEQSTDPATTH